MAEAQYLPYHFVEHLTKPGLSCLAGTIKLRTYMCKTLSNGGNDSATSLIGQLRWMKDGGTGPTLNNSAGGVAVDLCLKGQGSPDGFIAIWNFMIRNLDTVRKLKVEKCAKRDRKDSGTKIVIKHDTLENLYFKDRTKEAAIQTMVDDGFFGIDCVGFVSNFMIFTGEWTKYLGATPEQWPLWHVKQNVEKAKDIKPLDIVLWDNHIAIIDWVWDMKDDKTVEVDICQSSSGGPQCNERVHLRETGVMGPGSRPLFKIHAVGNPRMPVDNNCFLMRRKGFFW